MLSHEINRRIKKSSILIEDIDKYINTKKEYKRKQVEIDSISTIEFDNNFLLTQKFNKR